MINIFNNDFLIVDRVQQKWAHLGRPILILSHIGLDAGDGVHEIGIGIIVGIVIGILIYIYINMV